MNVYVKDRLVGWLFVPYDLRGRDTLVLIAPENMLAPPRDVGICGESPQTVRLDIQDYASASGERFPAINATEDQLSLLARFHEFQPRKGARQDDSMEQPDSMEQQVKLRNP